MSIYRPTWLYIKQHNQTGLKYFGKTTRDPLKYNGSGRYWNKHLAVHGSDISTIWCHLYIDKDELVEEAVAFSRAHNIVSATNKHKKKIWANEKPENGLDGGSLTPQIIDKMLQSKRLNGTSNPNSPESIRKRLDTMAKNGTFNSWTDDSYVKMRHTKELNNSLNPNTPESIAKRLATRAATGADIKSPCEFCGQMVAQSKHNFHKQSAKCKSKRVNHLCRDDPLA
jgi:hypothetical protein